MIKACLVLCGLANEATDASGFVNGCHDNRLHPAWHDMRLQPNMQHPKLCQSNFLMALSYACHLVPAELCKLQGIYTNAVWYMSML